MASFFFVFLFLGTALRILFGPTSYFGVIAYHYLQRIAMMSFMTMLTFKIVVKTMFILDFDRMAMVSEKKMIMCMTVTTTIFTLAHISAEALLRNHRKLDHYARWCFNVYLGKVNFVVIVLLMCI